MLNKLRRSVENDCTKQPKTSSSLPSKVNTASKTFFQPFFPKKQNGKCVTFSAEPQAIYHSEEKVLRKNPKDRSNQTDQPVKTVKSLPRIGVVQKDYIVNPRVQTTYQQHFNHTADLRLGYCDNRSIEERHRYFKNQKKIQTDLLQSMKEKNVANYRKYKMNSRQRISEYMAETSYVGNAIMKSGIHNHLKCPSKRCTHFITFK